MVVFENLSTPSRELFVECTSVYIEGIEKKFYEEESFIDLKKNINPNFDPQLYSREMIPTLQKQKQLLKMLQDKEPIPDRYEDVLREGVIGSIIFKMSKSEKPVYAEIKPELELKISKYNEIFKRHFPDDEAPVTLEEFIKRLEYYRSRGNIDPRM